MRQADKRSDSPITIFLCFLVMAFPPVWGLARFPWPGSFTFLELWVVFATCAAPVGYMGAYFLGRRYRNRAAEARMEEAYQRPTTVVFSDRGEDRIAAWLLPPCAVLWFMFIILYVYRWALFPALSQEALRRAAVLAGALLIAAELVGYRLGVTPMERQRRVGLVMICPLLAVFAGGYAFLFWDLRDTLSRSFWSGLPLGLISIALLWRYLVRHWHPATLSSTETAADRAFMRLQSGPLLPKVALALLVPALLIGLHIAFGGRQWVLSALFPLVIFVLTYMVVQVWRHRPR
jgi:hypothetical protein